ncbi:MAG: ATP-binding cassette domain-containing protein [Candidatus Electrothrix sp. AUS4]|nr:ATP-binding cassette domain-containing protein [Candidatus Electrothrix sp. AUS4]
MPLFNFSLNELVLKNDTHELRVEGIKFKVGKDNCAVALIGESGMGKTTIFKSLFPKYLELWRMSKQHRLSVNHSFNGDKFDEIDIQKNRLPLTIGFANQSPYFLEENSTTDNIFFPLKWTNTSQISSEKQLEYLSTWRIDNIAAKPLSILSGGQRQIVNLARVMVTKPDVLIIDECFSSMNEKLAKFYITLLKENYSDVCFIVTSHRHSDIEQFECTSFTLKKEQGRAGYFVVTLEG